MSRDRTHTMESVASHGSNAGLRERANTAGSIRSTQSGDMADDSSEFLMMRASLSSPSRQASSSSRRWSGVSSPHGGVFSSAVSSNKNRRLRQIVEWMQRQRVPAPLYRQSCRIWKSISSLFLRTDASSSGTSSTNNSNSVVIVDVQEDSVYWIEGLDRVVFGTSSAAEVVRLAGVQPPRYLWYMVSGAMCDVIQLCMDIMLHTTQMIEDASACWAVTFFLSVLFRHSFHRYLVFGDYVGGYKASLMRMYGGYSITIVLSTLFNILMTRVATFSHYVAWILTLLWTGIANYFILKKLWSFGGNK